jgi:purine-cytosine permease-like protein
MALGLVGVYLGASEQLFVGPLAAALNKVDIGFELGVVFAAISYLILRRIELNSSKR